MSPKIPEWNWILQRVLGLHKRKATVVVKIMLTESAKPMSSKLLSLFASSPPWLLLGLPPKLGHHERNIRFIQIMNYLVPTYSLCTMYSYCWKICICSLLLGHSNTKHELFHWLSCHILQCVSKIPTIIWYKAHYVINTFKCALCNNIEAGSLISGNWSLCFEVQILTDQNCLWIVMTLHHQ